MGLLSCGKMGMRLEVGPTVEHLSQMTVKPLHELKGEVALNNTNIVVTAVLSKSEVKKLFYIQLKKNIEYRDCSMTQTRE